MQRLALVWLFIALVSACGGGEDEPENSANSTSENVTTAPSSTEFIEPAPSEAALEKHVDNLLDEFEPLVPANTRAQFEEHAASDSPPNALADSTATVSGFLDLGEVAFLSGSASGATWAFLRAVQEDPDDIAALAQLGFVLTYEERNADARPFLLHAYELGPDELYTVLVTLALNYKAEGEYERCIYFLERAVSTQPDHGHLQHELAKCYFLGGSTTAGENALDIARRLSPDDPDIAATEANPPPADPTEQPNIAPAQTDDGVLFEATNACLEQYAQERVDKVAPHTQALYDADAEFTAQLVRGASMRSECEAQCHRDLPPGGAQQMCDAVCKSGECGNAKQAFGLARARMLDARSSYHGASASVRGSYAACSWHEYFRLYGRVARYERTAVWDMVYQQLESLHVEQVGIWSDSDENIVLLAEEVETICTAAQEQWEHVDWEHPYAFDPFRDIDFKACSPLLPALCFHITNRTVSVTTPLWLGSPLTGELSYDARTGKANVVVEAQVWSKSAGGGLVEGSASVKLDLQKGLGVKAEAKVAGGVNKTWSQERYFFTPRSD